MEEPAVAIVCVGMAGSGKTTFMQRINAHLFAENDPPYVINLDPAVHTVPFESNIDIRDSVNYKEVKKQYNLGPNGGILTSLNLFSTKIDQILALLEKRAAPSSNGPTSESTPANSTEKRVKRILVDTPGQIEVFVWSASGDILLSSLASSFPTVIAYVIDTPRTASTSTFMSNMLYACSILYKTKLPMILVFNKTDVQDAKFAIDWMTDFEAFQAALKREEETGSFGGLEGGDGPAAAGSGYMGSLLNSMSLMLEEFYRHLSVVAVSSMTGEGVDEFFKAVESKKAEFQRDYKQELDKRRAQREKETSQRREKELGRLLRDMNVGGASSERQTNPNASSHSAPETVSDAEDNDVDFSGELIEPDDDEDAQDSNASLAERYKRTLHQSGKANDPSGEDLSFTRYTNLASLDK